MAKRKCVGAVRIPTVLIVLCFASAAWCQTTRPAGPANKPDRILEQLLAPARNNPILPEPDAPRENQATRSAVAGKAESQNLIREGTWVVDRVGRLVRTPDGQTEFTFEADGQAMKDPPMLILPNLKLMTMENAVKNSSRNPKFRISAMVTEYGARNYILIEKIMVVPDSSPIQPQQKGEGQK